MNTFKIGGILVAGLLGATAMEVEILLAKDPRLLKRLVKPGAR